jgi:hypothetical protein
MFSWCCSFSSRDSFVLAALPSFDSMGGRSPSGGSFGLPSLPNLASLPNLGLSSGGGGFCGTAR